MFIKFGGLESLLLGVEVFEGKLQENGLEMCKTNGHGWHADSFEEILLGKKCCQQTWEGLCPLDLLHHFEEANGQVS